MDQIRGEHSIRPIGGYLYGTGVRDGTNWAEGNARGSGGAVGWVGGRKRAREVRTVVSFQCLKSVNVGDKGTAKGKFYSAVVFVLSTGSNVLVVIVSSVVAYLSIKDGVPPIRLTGAYQHETVVNRELTAPGVFPQVT